MTQYLISVFQLLILLSVITGFGYAQQNPQCDFSKYKPSFTVVDLHSNTATKEVQPDYPKLARSVGARGLVVVIILVDRKGSVKKACSNVGHPFLQTPAIKAALKWKFKPNFGSTQKSSYRYLQTYLSFNFQ